MCSHYVPFKFSIGSHPIGGVGLVFPWFSMCSHYVPFKFSMGSHPIGGVGLVFPWFSMCSHYVPFKFSMGSHMDFTMPPSSQCFPQHVLHSTSLISDMLWQMLSSFHVYRWANGGKNSPLQNRESLHSFFFFLNDGPVKLVHLQKEKKKIELERHLI
jgi:hypothetical protein